VIREHLAVERLFLMPDYESSSVWGLDEVMVPLEDLPLSDGTKRALEAWSAKLYDLMDAEDEGLNTSAQEKAHDQEGRRLWKVVRDELGGGYEVGYALFDSDVPPPTGDPILDEGPWRRIVWDPAELDG
jgi:hypothetical protein